MTGKQITIEGVIDEIHGRETTVILDNNGEDEERVMDTDLFHQQGIVHAGQSFYLTIMEYQEGGKTKHEVSVAPIGDPSKVATENIRPYLDTANLRKLG